MTFDVDAARKRAQKVRRDVHGAVIAEINSLVPFGKSKRLTTLIYRLEAAAAHHGRMLERAAKAKKPEVAP